MVWNYWTKFELDTNYQEMELELIPEVLDKMLGGSWKENSVDLNFQFFKNEVYSVTDLYVYFVQIVNHAGTFGQVVECLDLEKTEAVAIKIVRSLRKYREAAMIEIDVLQRLAKADISGTR